MDLKSEEDLQMNNSPSFLKVWCVNSDSQKNICFIFLRKLISKEGKVACKKSLKIESKEIADKALW